MREGWEIKKLGEIASVTYGFTGKALIDGNFRYVRITDIDNNGELTTEEKRYLEYSEEAEKYLLKNNDILMARTGATFAKVLLYEDLEPSVFASYLIKIDFKENIYNKLYWYFSKSENYWVQANSLSTGSAQPHFNGKALKDVVFTFPKSLSEQKQIVALLDEAFAAIDQAKANIEKNIENAKELFQSKLNDIFNQKGEGWEEKSLGELGTLTSSKRIYKKEYTTKGIPFYRSKEIKELAHKKEITLELFITEERYNEIKSRFGIPQEGDILLTAVGTIGEMYVVKNNEPDFYFKDGNIMWLKDFSTLNSYYLKYALLCFVEQLKAMSRGSAYSALTIEKLKKYSISVPSIHEQEKIVKQLDELLNYKRQVEKIYDEKMESLDDLKKSLLQKAFSGELSEPMMVND